MIGLISEYGCRARRSLQYDGLTDLYAGFGLVDVALLVFVLNWHSSRALSIAAQMAHVGDVIGLKAAMSRMSVDGFYLSAVNMLLVMSAGLLMMQAKRSFVCPRTG